MCVCAHVETTPLVLVGHCTSLFIVETGEVRSECVNVCVCETEEYAPILSSLKEAHFSDQQGIAFEFVAVPVQSVSVGVCVNDGKGSFSASSEPPEMTAEYAHAGEAGEQGAGGGRGADAPECCS